MFVGVSIDNGRIIFLLFILIFEISVALVVNTELFNVILNASLPFDVFNNHVAFVAVAFVAHAFNISFIFPL